MIFAIIYFACFIITFFISIILDARHRYNSNNTKTLFDGSWIPSLWLVLIFSPISLVVYIIYGIYKFYEYLVQKEIQLLNNKNKKD